MACINIPLILSNSFDYYFRKCLSLFYNFHQLSAIYMPLGPDHLGHTAFPVSWTGGKM